MSEVSAWAITAAGNAVAYDDIDLRDGMSRALVKTNARAMMAATRRMYDGIGSGNNMVSADTYIPAALIAAIRAGTSVADLSSYVALAVTAAGDSGKVQFGTGKYMFNAVIANRVTFKGAGPSTYLWPFSTATAVITHTDTYAGWRYVEHVDFTLQSASQAGIGLQVGPTVYVANCEYAGRIILRRVAAVGFDKAVVRSFGQIGFAAIDCAFQYNNYDFHVRDASRAGAIMHGGNMYVLRGEYSGTQIAHLYMDSAASGTGALIYDGVVHESIPGFVFFIKNWNVSGAAPTIEIRGGWNEVNNTAASVTIDGTAYAPKYLRAANCRSIHFVDTAIGKYELVASHLRTRLCFLDMIAGSTKDGTSTAAHRDARADSLATREMVESLDMAYRIAGGSATAVRMPHRRSTTKAWPNIAAVDCTAILAFTGTAAVSSATVATDGTVFGSCQELAVPSGATLIHGSYTVPVGKYIVAIIAAKLVSGNGASISVNGGATVAAMGAWATAGEWQTVVALTHTLAAPGFPASAIGFYVTPVSGATVIRLGGMAILAFDTPQAAIDFVASGYFPA